MKTIDNQGAFPTLGTLPWGVLKTFHEGVE